MEGFKLINLKGVRLAFKERVVFDGVDWFITDKSRIGLVGDNGAGKTTLLRILSGQMTVDDGVVSLPKDRTVGYLPQDLVELEDIPIVEYLKKRAGLTQMEARLAEAEHQVSLCKEDSAGLRSALAEHEQAQREFEHRGGFSFDAEARKVLRGLGFAPQDGDRSCEEFSGGWRMRIALAAVLLARPDILLMDEPTNHLDTESMEWLEGWLRDFRGVLITVSHDRRFLDKMVSQIADLSQGKLTLYSFSYEKYLQEKEARRERLIKEHEEQKEKIEQIQRFVERFRAKATKATQVQSRIKQLEKMEVVEVSSLSKTVHFRFPDAPRSGFEVIKGEQLCQQYGDHVVFSGLDFEIHRGEKIALVGVNGAGKSTLLRLLSQSEEPTSGTVTLGHKVRKGYFSQESAQNLNYRRTIWEEACHTGSKMTEAEKRGLLGAFLFSGEDIHKSIAVLSGGEKSRVSLFKLLLSDSNFLILDEPTNHLDMNTKELFQRALLQYAGTLLIVSHDRYFLDNLVDKVVEIRDGRLFTYPGNYSAFIEKRARQMEEENAAAECPAVKPKEVEPEPLQKSKEQKRQEAHERNRIYRLRKEIQDQIDPIETEIAQIEARQSEIDALLCDPKVLADSPLVQELFIERKTSETALADIYAKWELLAAQMEEIN